MTVFEIAALLIVLAALFSYFNCALLKFPRAIGLMAMSLAASLVLVVIGLVVPAVEQRAAAVVHQIDLTQTFLHGMLGLLLFAGALHVRLDELATRKWTILTLASVGVIVSTAVVGLLAWGLLNAAGVPARLEVWEGMIHAWHLYASALEDGRRAIAELGAFVRNHTKE